MNELALFAGAGGGILGGHLLGWRTIVAVERDAYAAQVLAARQNDRTIQTFPIWSDVKTFDGEPWAGIVDVVSGGFPCQDISIAGKGEGIDGERSGLWSEMRRIIRQVEPKFVYVENSPMLTSRGLGRILGDLAKMGFDAEWGCLSASDTSAPHIRERIWVLAYSCCEGLPVSWPVTLGKNRWQTGGMFTAGGRWPSETGICRVDDGVAYRVDRIKALGNGQVPRVAAAAWSILSKV